jgi:CHAT domain-containing protein/tetratricopeptide (TPR) repeat protein
MLTPLLALALAVGNLPSQEAGDPAALPAVLDRVVEIVLDEKDPLLSGHGACERVEHEVRFSGTLHVWTKVEGDLDTFLKAEDAEGKFLAKDDDSGGKPTPYLKLKVEPGRKLVIVVAASKTGGTGKVELHLVSAPETDTTRAEAERARQELAEIKKLREAKDLTAARARAEALAEHLLGVEGGAQSEALTQQAWLLSYECDALALLRPDEKMRRCVLSHRTRTLPDDHPDLQSARLNLAVTIFSLGDLVGARALDEKVLEVRSRTLPDDHPDLQSVRLNLAGALHALGGFAGARALFEKVVEVLARTLPDDHPDLQRARGNLAITIRDQGDLAGARAVQERVLEVSSKALPDDHPDLQWARRSLATTLYMLGDLARARALFEKELEVDSRTLPDDHPDLQAARLNLASTIKALGDLAGARALQEKVLEVRSKTLPDDHPDLQMARGNLAGTIASLGDLAGARALQEKVLEVASRTLPDDHPDLLMARGNLAATIGDLGDLAGARALQEKVLEVASRTLPDDHPNLQVARLNLAVTLHSLGDLAGARALQQKVLEVRSKTLRDDNPDLQIVRGNLADTSRRLGDLAGARALQEKVLEVDSRTLSDDHPDLQTVRENLAVTIAAQARGEAGREEKRDGKEEGGRQRFVGLVRDYMRGQRHAALQSVLDASGREAEERVASRKQLGKALSMARGCGVFGSDPALEEQAFLFSEGTRNVASLSARLGRAARSNPNWEELRGRMQQATSRLAALGQKGATSAEFTGARTDLERTQRELVQLGKRLDPDAMAALQADFPSVSSRVGEHEAWVGYRRYALTELGEAGAESSTASLCAFVVRSGGRLARIELGPIEPVEKAIEAWREAIGVRLERGIGVDPASSATALDRGSEVRRLVLDPLREALSGAERLAVSPDDVLHLVPLDALPSGRAPARSSAPLGEILRIEVALNLLLRDRGGSEREVSRDGILVALGHADFDHPPGEVEPPLEAEGSSRLAGSRDADRSGILRGGAWERGFATLPETRAEVKAIGDYYQAEFGDKSRAMVLESRRASRENLFALAPKARFLHVATHGWYAPESIRSSEDPEPLDVKMKFGMRTGLEESVKGMSPMLLCGLALAGANLPANELGRIPGLVTAEEISALDLSSCELVVLSACDTNVGLRRAGQGVASLQKALHMAGARSVITSLWRVPDEATRELMVDFYRRIWVEKKPKAQALWEAKSKLRNAKDESGHPKYTTRDWAAWVLTGAAG